METLAARMGTPCAQLRDGIQLPSPQGYLWMQRCVHNLTPPEAAALSQATGVDRTVLQATTLSHYDGRAVLIDRPHRGVKAGFPWGWGSGSKYCPACLHDTQGRWQLRWRLGWSFACPRHHCLLAKLCPSCGKAQRQRPFPGDIVPTPGRCATPIHSAETPSIRRCNADLSAVTVARFDEDHPLLAAQRTVYDIIDGSRPHFGVYRHSDYAPVEILNDLCAVAVRVLTYASDEELAKIVPADLHSLYLENNVPSDKRSQS
ncbi:TniQ family protein, partial [Caballeronia sp.]|uniref:TniQ family protein n=1 Tax=Caballeronia sp. TaxID=1931223 RepID=UPI003C576DEE